MKLNKLESNMRILVVVLGRLGDMVLATPMFSTIKRKYPDSELFLLAGEHNHHIIKGNPNLSDIYVYEKNPIKIIKLFLKIRRMKFDYLIDPKDHYSNESSLIAKFSKAIHKIGFNKENTNTFDITLDNDVINYDLHFTERCLKSLKYLGVEPFSVIPKPEIIVNEQIDKEITEKLNGLRDFILINTSSNSEFRMWGDENWYNFISKISQNNTLVVIYQKDRINFIIELLSKNIQVVVIESNNIFEAVSIIKCAKMLITPDTSLVHIASAFNVPVLGLYISNQANFKKFYPLSDNHEVVHSPDEVVGIKSITVDDLYYGFIRLISKIDRSSI